MIGRASGKALSGNGPSPLRNTVYVLGLFSFASSVYFLSQLRYEHKQVSFAMQGFEIRMARLQEREKRSMAHISERFNELRTQVIDMEMEYDAMSDHIRQAKEIAERANSETNGRVEAIGSKVSGIGTLLGRMPTLLQKVEAENRDSVDSVNTKIKKLEGLLGNPSLRSYLSSDSDKKLGSTDPFDSLNSLESGKAGGLGSAISSADVRESSDTDAKSDSDINSPSDLPQLPRSSNSKILKDDGKPEVPVAGSINTDGIKSRLGATDKQTGDGTCEIPSHWADAPSALETYGDYMATGEHYLGTEDFAKAIACFNIAEKLRHTVGRDQLAAARKGDRVFMRPSSESSSSDPIVSAGGSSRKVRNDASNPKKNSEIELSIDANVPQSPQVKSSEDSEVGASSIPQLSSRNAH